MPLQSKKTKKSFKWYHAIGLVILLFVVVGGLTQLLIATLHALSLPPAVTKLGEYLSLAVSYVVFIWLVHYRRGRTFDFSDLGDMHVQVNMQVIALSVALAFFIQATLTPLLSQVALSESLESFSNDLAMYPMLGMLLILIVAPVFEELIFRGMILEGLLGSTPAWLSIVISGLLFGAFHGNVHQFVAASTLGLAIGWVYVRVRKLRYVILIHFAYNFSVMVSTGVLMTSTGLEKVVWPVTLVSGLVGVLAMKKLKHLSEGLEKPSIKPYREALVMGKFMPFHQGHKALIDYALSQADTVIVLVVDKCDQEIPLDLRLEWLRNHYRDLPLEVAPFVHNLPHDGAFRQEDTLLWCEAIAKACPTCDVFVSSEAHGDLLADYMNIDHLVYELDRSSHPISGSQIRQNPRAYYHYLTPEALAYYTQKEG